MENINDTENNSEEEGEEKTENLLEKIADLKAEIQELKTVIEELLNAKSRLPEFAAKTESIFGRYEDIKNVFKRKDKN